MAKLTKEEASRILSDVPEENKFWCNDGTVCGNLQDLEVALRNMNNETFDHHVNEEKNDFSNWVRDIIKDNHLAEELTKARNRNNALKKVRNRLRTLNRLDR